MHPLQRMAEWNHQAQERIEAAAKAIPPPVPGRVEGLAEVAHDARNMVTALGLYCDLLEEPGVLAAPYAHYSNELRLVATASRRLMEKLLALEERGGKGLMPLEPAAGRARPPASVGVDQKPRQAHRWDLMPALPIENLAAELMANRNLLGALAGPSVTLTVQIVGGSLPVRLTGEDLTRVLVNLVKNAAEAMPAGGRIQLGLRERPSPGGRPESLEINVDDSGPGIAEGALEKIFEAGFSTQTVVVGASGWPAAHRGLGLSITRSIVESAGGSIVALNREPAGARFQIQLPVRTR